MPNYLIWIFLVFSLRLCQKCHKYICFHSNRNYFHTKSIPCKTHTCRNRERTASKNSIADGWSNACKDACSNKTFYEIASHKQNGAQFVNEHWTVHNEMEARTQKSDWTLFSIFFIFLVLKTSFSVRLFFAVAKLYLLHVFSWVEKWWLLIYETFKF